MADMIVDSIDLGRYQRLLDVGGGPGTYTMAFLRRAPHMSATLFDLPRVTEIARKHLTQEGLIHRVQIVEGDYTADELPAGHDLALLSAIIHSNSRQGNLDLYKKIFRSLNPGGSILIRDFLMDPTHTRPVEGAIFAVNMLAATEGGTTYTFEETKQDLETAGFSDVRLIRDGERMDQLVLAVK
jgi:ubiquinone/menaquinone biosynthesis C-methylase UbiE